MMCNVCAWTEFDEHMACKQCGAPAAATYAAAAAARTHVGYGAHTAAPASVKPGVPVVRKKGVGGKLFAIVLVLAGVVGIGWWANVARERSAAEQRQRALVEQYGPVTVESVELRNTNYNGEPLSPPASTFTRRELRFLSFRATLRNNGAGLEGVSGKLGVKYIAPTEQVAAADPSGYTFQLPLSVSAEEETKPVSSSWGSDSGGSFRRAGNWRVEFWFNGRKVGEAPFTVN